MKIKKLHIKNFKSLVDLEIVEPNPFTVFVGANGVGKSNIFEALEFAKANISYTDLSTKIDPSRLNNPVSINIPTDLIGIIERQFGGRDSFLNFSSIEKEFVYECNYDSVGSSLNLDYTKVPTDYFVNLPIHPNNWDVSIYQKFYNNFSRLFIGRDELNKLEALKLADSSKALITSCRNLERVLGRLLLDDIKKEEILDWLKLFVPEFVNIEVRSDDVKGTDELRIYEKGSNKPFHKKLISDGTYNILCLLTAVFQSDEPQFLCIDEPENGLNPFVIKELVNLFRTACLEKKHYIWVNTHSQSLVEMLTPDEIVLVDKKNGNTEITQIQKMNLHGLPMDEAWISGALGGGVPW
ncbi:chromosome segregation protein SMC [Dyadobacter frigoris]|uniref:Chromosome segregation protein SMC n=1 Tax=Dyadobacter frigoris TaxID=2576211 RepID=A0A4U6D4I7_9BACT|nr:chromosome segregation protein SMC [Dyadobacter frigoris]